MKKTRLIPSLVLLFFFQSALSQTCGGLIDSADLFYNRNDHKQALAYFKKAVAMKCDMNNIHYYNGACIASLAGQPTLANQWLTKSVALGYSDTLHMAKDTDLDPIRNSPGYKQVILKIRKAGEATIKELQTIKTENDFINAVPYSLKGKWGWMHAETGKALTPARYDFTDFLSGNGLYFTKAGQGYFWTRDGKLLTYTKGDYFDDSAPVGLMESEQEPSRTKEAGFSEYNGHVQSYAEQYLQLKLITSYYKGRPLAAVRNKEGLCAIIRSDGTVHEPFGFFYKQIMPVKRYQESPFVQLVKEGESAFSLWSLDGSQVFKEPFTELKEVENYDYYPDNNQGHHFYTGLSTGKYVILKTAKGSVVYDLLLQRAVTGFYDTIIMANGRTSDKTRQGSYGNTGIFNAFFLVEHKGSRFYVNAGSGKEYRINPK